MSHSRFFLSKLKSNGISDPIFGWTEDSHKERRQNIIVNGAEPELKSVLSGIPQGSVLGPLYFVLHINDFPDMVGSETFIFFR